MINRTIEIKASPEEVAELLFELDNKEVAEVFSIWKRKFDEEYDRRKEAREPIWIFDLNHFILHVLTEMDDDGKEFFRTGYANMIYLMQQDTFNKHKLDLR